jgi:hypothetical protein
VGLNSACVRGAAEGEGEGAKPGVRVFEGVVIKQRSELLISALFGSLTIPGSFGAVKEAEIADG